MVGRKEEEMSKIDGKGRMDGGKEEEEEEY